MSSVEQAVIGAIAAGSFGTLRRIFTLLEDGKGASFPTCSPRSSRAPLFRLPPRRWNVEDGVQERHMDRELSADGRYADVAFVWPQTTEGFRAEARRNAEVRVRNVHRANGEGRGTEG